MSTSNWREKAREGMEATVKLVAEHGNKVGLASASVLGCVAAGSMFMAMGADTEAASTLYREGSATFLLAGLLKAGFWVGAEQVARSYLAVKGDDIFDDSWRAQAIEVSSARRGAVPVTDDPTRGPEFQKAVQAVMSGLEKNPDAKAFMINVLKSSPEARELLINSSFNTQSLGSTNLIHAAESLMKGAGPESAGPGDESPKLG
jgi:hypothetical protein